MDLAQAALLGIVEGLTEFLPVSSTGHLTIAEKLLDLPVKDRGVTAFTAVIQLGAIAAVIVHFRGDISRLVAAWIRGILRPARRDDVDYRMAWYVIFGSIPIAVVGLLGKNVISGPLRSLWVVAAALIGWSFVMSRAERRGRQLRGAAQLTRRDVIVVGVVQCIALIPGVSRSGATISAGLFRDLDRTTATRLSFLLAIPALTAAGAYEALSEMSSISATVGWGSTVIGTAVSGIVAYVAISWLLRLVVRHPITIFVGYRVGLGVVLAAALTVAYVR